MRIAIVHDWLVTFAGAERVLKELILLFPDADLYALVDFLSDQDRAHLSNKMTNTSFLQRLPGAKKHYRSFLPLMPLAAVDAYVMSSAWEGMPMVLLEASAVGLPIVATDVGGNREVVLDGETGFLVPPKNAHALAQAMMTVMDIPAEARTAMGEAGRKNIESKYSMDRVVEMWEALYMELLQRKGVRV